MSTNTLHITACDNELIVLAYQWGASFEVCTILSGNSNSVDVTIPINTGPYQDGIKLDGVNSPLSGTYPVSLVVGDYSLAFIGIDWGGPEQFSFTFNGQTYELPYGNNADGLVWTPPVVPFTVP